MNVRKYLNRVTIGSALILVGLILLAIYPTLTVKKSEEIAMATILPVRVDLSVSKTTVKVGESYEITVRVTNYGRFPIYGYITILSNGVVEDARPVYLPPGQTVVHELTAVKGTPGTYVYKAVFGRVVCVGCLPLRDVVVSNEVTVNVLKVSNVYLDFKADKYAVEEGEPFTLIAKVTNNESVPISGTLEIKTDNRIIQTFSVFLNPGESKEYAVTLVGTAGANRFVASLSAEGTTVESSLTVYVYKLGERTSVSLTASSTEVLVGKTVELTAVAVNNHDKPVSGILYILKDGKIVFSAPVTIPAKGSVKASYTFTSSTAGTYTFKAKLVVGDYTKESQEVKVRFTSVVGKVLMSLTAPSNVRPNETYFVEVKVTNDRNIPLYGTLEVLCNNVTEYSKNVTLMPNESATFTYSTYKSEEGLYAYIARIVTWNANYVSNVVIVKVKEPMLKKVIESAGTVDGVPVMPVGLMAIGAVTIASRRFF